MVTAELQDSRTKTEAELAACSALREELQGKKVAVRIARAAGYRVSPLPEPLRSSSPVPSSSSSAGWSHMQITLSAQGPLRAGAFTVSLSAFFKSPVPVNQNAPKEQKRHHSEKPTSKTVLLESPFSPLPPLKFALRLWKPWEKPSNWSASRCWISGCQSHRSNHLIPLFTFFPLSDVNCMYV